MGFRHRVFREISFGELERPGGVVNFCADWAAGSIYGVEAIALRQEMFEGAGNWGLRRRDWAIFEEELR